MAGHGQDDDPNLKGLARHFNNQTIRGRANVSIYFGKPSQNFDTAALTLLQS